MKKNSLHKFLVATLLLTLPAFLAGCGTNQEPKVTGGFDPQEGLILSGNLESKEVDLNTKIPGKITKIHISEGQEVKAGDVIAEIDNTQLLAKKSQVEAQVKMAKEAVALQKEITNSNLTQAQGASKAANAQLAKAKKGARTQELAQAEAYYEMMQKTYDRVDELFGKGAVSAQKKDEVEAQLKIAKEKLSLAKEGAQGEDIEAAKGLVDKAEGAVAAAEASKMQITLAEQKYQEALAGLEEVKSLLADTKILAPMSGTVTSLNCEQGELVSSGMPIATIADLKNLTIKLKVYETDLEKIQLNSEVKVRFASLGEKTFPGKITKIATKPEFATQKAANNENSDILAYDVKVEMTNADNEKIYPGMTTYVLIPK